jgi:O-antigen/teichoic acid export membrane protein
VRSRIEYQALGFSGIAVGLVLVLTMFALDPEPLDGLLDFALAGTVFGLFGFFSLRSRLKRQVAKARPASAANVERVSTLARRLLWSVAFWGAFGVVAAAIDRTLIGVVAGTAVGAGASALLVARWLSRLERAMGVRVFESPRQWRTLTRRGQVLVIPDASSRLRE